MVTKQLKLLQNKLDKATMSFNHADAENKQLRAEIDALRKQVRRDGRARPPRALRAAVSDPDARQPLSLRLSLH